jgi:Cof subfamily protein (haloacid dehalogenase superfamily)
VKPLLVISDLDGTLVNPGKELTPRARAAVQCLKHEGVGFTIVSGRPPRGMLHVVKELGVELPFAAFNGGIISAPDLEFLENWRMPAEYVRKSIALLGENGLDVWLYRGTEWLVRDRSAAHVEQERRTVRFDPTVVVSYEGIEEGVSKIVGISDDLEAVARCEFLVHEALDGKVSAARSQPYYLDITHPNANKGHVVEYLSRRLRVPPDRIATLGDMPNDVLMFERSGLSIAMGNASEEVKAHADFTTSSNGEDGFAEAVDKIILNEAVWKESA